MKKALLIALLAAASLTRSAALSYRLIIFLLILSSSARLQAQEAKSPSDIRKERASLLTEELLKDVGALTPISRSLLLARLADIWWSDKPDQSRIWLHKTVENLEIPSDADQKVRKQYLEAANAILPIVSSRDKVLSKKLLDLFADNSERLPGSDRTENAKALVELALSIAADDPKQAVELATASLRVGRTPQLTTLLWRLRERDSGLADSLFRYALALSKENYDGELLLYLTNAAYPSPQPVGKKSGQADNLNTLLLLVIADALLRPFSSAEQKIEVCRFAPIVAPLLDEVYRLLPQQAGLVRNAINECQAVLPSGARQQVSDSLKDLPLQTAEDYRQAAEKAPDAPTQAVYSLRAAFMANEQKDYKRAIEILDGMSSEARKHLGETWERVRWNFAANGALARLAASDLYSMQKFITDAPPRLRALVQLKVAAQKNKAGDKTQIIEMLSEIRSGLEKVEILSEKIHGYFVLIDLYATVIPSDAVMVLGETVKALNRLEPDGKSDVGAKEPGSEMWQAVNLPLSLFDIDEVGFRYTLSLIKSPITRVSLRYGLLEAILGHDGNKANPKDKPRTTRKS